MANATFQNGAGSSEEQKVDPFTDIYSAMEEDEHKTMNSL